LSLFGALSLGSSSLAAQQAALQVTGNNISNAGTQGYTREVTNFAPIGSDQVAPGQTTGDGVTISSIERQVNEALNENLRDATSDQNSAQTLNSTLTQLQSTFGALNSGDLSSQLSSFFGGFSTLATNPTDSSMQAQVIQNGTSIAEYLQNLQSQVSSIQTNTNAQIGTLTQQANTLLQGVASLNQQIAGSGANGANSLMDQRDQDLTQLSQLMNITTVDQGNGMVNVLGGIRRW
jgi:flagellar hook-associated protein 1 FlgK